MPNLQPFLVAVIFLANQNPWLQKAAQIKPGMTRAQVEQRMLPPFLITGKIMHGSAQRVDYQVNKRWKVSIWYDYTGLDYEGTDAREAIMKSDNPLNIVRSKPGLYREDMLEPGVATVEVIRRGQ